MNVSHYINYTRNDCSAMRKGLMNALFISLPIFGSDFFTVPLFESPSVDSLIVKEEWLAPAPVIRPGNAKGVIDGIGLGSDRQQVLIHDIKTGQKYYVDRKYFLFLLAMAFESTLAFEEDIMNGGVQADVALNDLYHQFRRCGGGGGSGSDENGTPNPTEPDSTPPPVILPDSNEPPTGSGHADQSYSTGTDVDDMNQGVWLQEDKIAESPPLLCVSPKRSREENSADSVAAKRACLEDVRGQPVPWASTLAILTQMQSDISDLKQGFDILSQGLTNQIQCLKSLSEKVSESLQLQRIQQQHLINQQPLRVLAEVGTQTCLEDLSSATLCVPIQNADTAHTVGDEVVVVSSELVVSSTDDSIGAANGEIGPCSSEASGETDGDILSDSAPNPILVLIRDFPLLQTDEDEDSYRIRVMRFINLISTQNHPNLCIEAREVKGEIGVYATKRFDSGEVIADNYYGDEFTHESGVAEEIQQFLQGFRVKRRDVFVLSDTPFIFYKESKITWNVKIEMKTRKVLACDIICEGEQLLFKYNR